MIYEIAGLPVEMNPRYPRLLKQSEAYRLSEYAGENPDIISVKTSGVNTIIPPHFHTCYEGGTGSLR